MQEEQLAPETADSKLSSLGLAEHGRAVAGALHGDRRRPGEQREEVHVVAGDAAGLDVPTGRYVRLDRYRVFELLRG